MADAFKYKDRTIKAIASTKRSIAARQDSIQRYTKQRQEATGSYDALLLSMDVVPQAVKHTLAEAAKKEAKTIANMETAIAKEQGRIQEDRANLCFIQQYVCPHSNTVYDHTDYHKNEDFHKCTLCDHII